jgi:tetratricopeptide (TPR) repeat protein
MAATASDTVGKIVGKSIWRRLLAGLSAVIVAAGLAIYLLAPLFTLRAATQALERGELSAARRYATEFLQKRPDNSEALLLAARAAGIDGDAVEASRLISRAEKLVPADAALERSLLQIRSGDLTDTTGLLAESVDQLDQSRMKHVLAAVIDGGIHGMQPGVVKQSLELWDSDSAASDTAARSMSCMWRGGLEWISSQPDVGIKHLREALTIEPRNEQARLLLAELLLRYDPAESLTHLEFLRTRKPSNRAVLIRLAGCCRELGRLNEAGTILDQLLSESPSDFPAILERGRVALDAGNAEQAESFFRRAEALAPTHREVSLGLARCLQLAGRAEEAEKYRQQTAAADKDDSEATAPGNALGERP